MKIVAGLGNPGVKYENTRHNAGFRAIRSLEPDEFGWKKQGNALVKKVQLGRENVLLAMPQTYMNLSGEPLGALLRFYKLKPEDLLVLVDDVNLELGRMRIRGKGSHGGQNGLKNIITHVGSAFSRVRLGIGPCPASWEMANFVLSKFSKEDDMAFGKVLEDVPAVVETIFACSLEEAMNCYNS